MGTDHHGQALPLRVSSGTEKCHMDALVTKLPVNSGYIRKDGAISNPQDSGHKKSSQSQSFSVE